MNQKGKEETIKSELRKDYEAFWKANPEFEAYLRSVVEDINETDIVNTKVINIHKINGNRPNFDIYIGRALPPWMDKEGIFRVSSKWANPFPVKEYGEKSIPMYRSHIIKRIVEEPEYYNLRELIGKLIGCWCKPNPCHGDVIVELITLFLKSLMPYTEWVQKELPFKL